MCAFTEKQKKGEQLCTWILAAVPAALVLAFAGMLLCRRLAFQNAVRQLEEFQFDLLARQVNEEENLYRRLWDAHAQYYAQEDTPQPQPTLIAPTGPS